MSASNEIESISHHHWLKTLLEKIAFLAVILVLGALLLPYVIPSANRFVPFDDGQLTHITRAIKSYETSFGTLPPAYTVDEAGNKLHSWRTLILPYLGERNLYDAIDLSKPWDAPENATARAFDVPAYESPRIKLPKGQTLYRVIIDPNGLFTGSQPSFAKAHPSAILVVQAGKDQSTHWMAPDEYSLKDFRSISQTNASGRDGLTPIAQLSGYITSILANKATEEQVLGQSAKANQVPPGTR